MKSASKRGPGKAPRRRAAHAEAASPARRAPRGAEPAVDMDRLFHALGDATRRALLDRLCAGPLSVTRLAEPLGVSVTAVMQHLTILESVQLVKTEKHGRVRSCRIEPAGFDALEQWVKAHRTLWEKRLDRLGEFLGEE